MLKLIDFCKNHECVPSKRDKESAIDEEREIDKQRGVPGSESEDLKWGFWEVSWILRSGHGL